MYRNKTIFKYSHLFHSKTPFYSKTLLNDPYINLYEKEGYKQIKELEKFRKLLNDIENIHQDELLINNDNDNKNILQSTEYFNLHFGQFEHESINFDLIKSSLSISDYLLLFDSSIITHCIHIQSRLASFEGKGYYTIGPCGEECISPIGLLLQLTDCTAFHYRHLSANIARNLKRKMYDGNIDNNCDILSSVIRDRARGYVVSINDPISSGGHCLLGSNDFNYDYIVTSTLASQTGPAVGRAFGNILYNTLKLPNPKFKTGSISFVSVGDGSINNSHFLSAINIVDYAIHNNVKVPLLIAITNNKLCISLRDKNNWLFTYLNKLLNFKKYKCNGNNIFDVYQQFKLSIDYVRKTQKPAIIVIDEIIRQFGHAATDRQSAYLTQNEIESAANNPLLLNLCKQFIKLGIFEDKYQCLYRILFLSNLVKKEFENVYNEPKLESTEENRVIVKNRNSAPLIPYKIKINNNEIKNKLNKIMNDNGIGFGKKCVMRKCMIYIIEEILNIYPNCVYIGEDVSHGGYYLVTDGLCNKYPLRIRDFPPDETILFGIGIGYSQSGLLPIIEMPYAKYLDCGADMFYESIIMNWLSAGKQSNGILFRLQGFGNGLFGGNFHTHNSLNIPPGLDILCYSNGYDYINGWRYIIQQVQNGRCIMSVDCTQQLNNRHVYGENIKDGLLLNNIPNYNEYYTFNDIIIYNNNNYKYIIYNSNENCKNRYVDKIENGAYYDINNNDNNNIPIFIKNKNKKKDGLNIIIITYGLGVNISRQAQNELLSDNNNNNNINDILVIDTPYLNDICNQLRILLLKNDIINNIDCILFADMCKEGQNPLNGIIIKLQQENILKNYLWLSCAAQFTYNPLGKDLTFLSKNDIIHAVKRLIKDSL